VTETAEVLGGDVRFHHDGDGTTVTCRLPHQGTVADPVAARVGAHEA
jgi:signal transduction histidine kinase